jgi:hypothetical protein
VATVNITDLCAWTIPIHKNENKIIKILFLII